MLKQEGFKFLFNESKCRECGGKCCKGESGYIFLKPQEMENIANFLGMNFNSFSVKFVRKVGYKYSLIEKKEQNGKGYACVFFDEVSSKCQIYDVRPMQCRTFPFWDCFKENFSELKNECMGIDDEI